MANMYDAVFTLLWQLHILEAFIFQKVFFLFMVVFAKIGGQNKSYQWSTRPYPQSYQ